MKILVIVKQVISEPSTLQMKQYEIDFSQNTSQTSSLDLVAIEQAVLLKEQGLISHITVCCIGGKVLDKSLRTALAMGVQDGVHIVTDHHQLDILGYAKLLQAYISEQNFSLVITGREDFDGGAGQSGTLLAGLLGWGHADYVTSIEKCDDEACHVGCDDVLGHKDYILSLPGIVSVDLGLNQPRFVKFPQLLKARKHPILTREATEFNLDLDPSFESVGLQKIEQNRQQTILKDVAELAVILKQHPELR